MINLKKMTLYCVSVLLMFSAIYFGPAPKMFINIPSVLIVFLITAVLMMGCYGKKAFRLYSLKGTEKNILIDVWSKCLMMCAWAGFIIGVVQMLSNMRDPKSIGPALAVSLLVLLYAFLARLFLLEPFRDLEE